MTLQEIFDNALRLVCELPSEDHSGDYEERAGYILANFCCQNAEADRRFRLANGMTEKVYTSEAFIELSSEFSLSDIFTTAAAYYLAAMLVFDENEEMSDKLFAMYTDAISAIEASLPSIKEEIVDRYSIF